uniref:exonuclease mut-7 homolog n=1 Tax=Euleptes europaea TaxID=460621 RepID=UPI002541166C|nr:exonuclease mut-7 homolog [Euleptes europaea]
MLEDSNPVDDFDGQDPLSLLKKLQSLLAKKEMEKLREEIWLAFAAFENPLEWLLDVLEASSDWKGKGHSLAYNIAHELQFWIKEHPNGQLLEFLCLISQSGLRLRKLQSRVFPVLAQSQINLLDLLISIYHLHDADRYHLLGHINHLYHEDKFKEAVVLSIKLKLQPDLDVEKMCVPLLLQDKMNLVESYVEEYPDLQQQLLRLLDSWCEPGFRTETITKQYQGVPNIRPEKVNRKLLSKLIFRFLDKYSLDPALCPNTINQRHLGTLKYLLYKRFVEKTMTQENWTDHVQCTIGNNRWLQEQLVQLLASYCRLNAAATWALHYSLPEDSLPCRVADELKALKSQKRDDAVKQKEANCEEWRKDHYYQLPIPREDVLILSTWEEVQKCKEHVLQPGQVVGIDMEWRPSFGAVGEKSRVSLVQMAVHGQVFLLDMLQLLNQDGNNEEALSSFFQTLFADPTITKLGYGMSGDLHSLGLTCTGFKDLDKHLSGVLDLLAVHKQLPKSSGAVKKGSRKVNALPWEDEAERCGRLPEKGLSLLVQHVLGKPLDKTEQLSNWEKRPLREGQILYAALDAYCLLEIYTKLQNDLAGFGLNPDILTLQPKKVCPEVRAKKLPRKQRMPPACNEESAANVKENPSSSVSILVSDFRVVCDNMLQGLGRHLRCLGVDVRMLENDDDHRKAAELARQEDRVILTSGLPYQTLRSQVGEGRCFSVDCSEKAKEQALRVLKHFNVQVTLADVFSRCQACNCNQYLKISKEKMMQLMKRRGFWTEAENTAGELSENRSANFEAETPKLSSRQPVYSPNCQWLEESGLDTNSALLPNGTSLKIEAVPIGVLSKEDLAYFYCCGQCGKVFWEGSHFGRVVSQFEEMLDLSEDHQSFYEQN